jgi:hypothetical protein
MAWAGQWSYKVGPIGAAGTEINDRSTFYCVIPELDNLVEMDTILAEITGDYPVFIRSQQRPSRLTFNIAMGRGTTDALWQTRLATLKGLFPQGVLTQLTVQARGMSSAKTMKFVAEGMLTDFRARIVSVRAVAPKPVLE